MISLILLASGFGNRFGSNKLMYEINGKKMYLHILEKLQHLMDSDTEVLVVSQYDEIIDMAKKCGMKAVPNDGASEGIAASVRLGVKETPDSDWYFFFNADQPYLKEDTIRGFIEAVLNNANKTTETMASVCCNNMPGSPTAFNRIWRDDLLALTGDIGGRKLMKKQPASVFWYEIPEEDIVDIDFTN